MLSNGTGVAYVIGRLVISGSDLSTVTPNN